MAQGMLSIFLDEMLENCFDPTIVAGNILESIRAFADPSSIKKTNQKFIKAMGCTILFFEGNEKTLSERTFILNMDACASCKQHATTEIKLKKCARCISTYYCSAACQKKDWPQHKKVCQIQDNNV